MTDTALKTADSGYLTRRLVDVAQDVIIREDDCGTDRGLLIRSITEGKEMIESLEERLNGRYTKKTVKHPETGAVIIGPNELITEDKALKLLMLVLKKVTIRSVFTCNTRHGVCRHCYGINLATGDAVEVGEAVGTIAAQSIGEPGTQLPCVPSTRVGLPQIPISRKVFLVSKKSLKPAIRKGKRSSLRSRGSHSY